MRMKTILLAVLLISSVIIYAQPNITSFDPTSGPVGSIVTITGTNFNTSPAGNIVFFGATKAAVSAVTATQLTVTVPAGASYQPISVTNLTTALTVYSDKPFVTTFACGGTMKTSSFAAKFNLATVSDGYTYMAACGDLDGDGKPDLAVANYGSNTVSVFRNNSTSGSISFAARVDFATDGPTDVAIGDVNGDGKPDLVVASFGFNTAVSVLKNTSIIGNISFAGKVYFAAGKYPSSVSIGDMDGDGKPDLVVANDATNMVSVYRNTGNNGTISFAAKVDFATGYYPLSVSIGDLDDDGKPDLAIANTGSNTTFSVFRNTSNSGTISFAPKVDFITGSSPISVSIGDTDGDGKPDLVVANNDDNTVSVFRNSSNRGSVSFANKVDFTTGLHPYSVTFGDMDGDGKPDLAVSNSGSNTVSVLINTSTSGSISFATKVDFATGGYPRSVSTGDLNGDGKPDLAVVNYNDNTISVFRNNPINPLPAATAGAARQICLNTATTLGAAAVTGSTYNWTSVPAGFTSTLANPSVTPLVTTTYTVTETITASRCINSNSIVVTVNPLPAATAGVDRPVCLNTSTTLGAAAVTGSTYSWTSVPAGFTSTLANPFVTPLVTTIYKVTETITATGCVNTQSAAVTVNPLPAAVAGAARPVCLNTSTTIGAAPVTGSTYCWTSVPAGYTSTLANPSVTPLVTTTYTVTETITATGCVNSHSVVVTIHALPAAIAGSHRSVCVNTATTLGAAAVTGSTYSWTSVPAGFTSSLANPVVTPMVTTTYKVTETITATGCVNSNSVVITVHPLPAASAGADRSVCLNTTTTLGAAAVTGSTYSWTSVPAGFTSTQANPAVTPLVTATYTVTETITATGCYNAHSVVITVNPLPAAAVGADRAICLNESTTLGASVVTGNTFSWTSVPAGFTSTLANPSVTPLETTIYMVTETITATGCSNMNSVVVTVNPFPAATAGAARPVCLNTATTLGAEAATGSTYSWTSVPEGFTSTLANPLVIPLVTTTYTVTETITATGCVNSNSVLVTVHPLPDAVAGASRLVCLNTATTLGAAAVPGSTYNWIAANAGFTSTLANPAITPLVTTIYALTETITATGCANSNIVVVTVQPLPDAMAGADRSVCLNTATTLGAEAITGSTYNWISVPAGFISTLANPAVAPLVTTTYTVTETITATGCVNSNNVVVTVSLPAVVAGADRLVCLNTATILGAEAVTGSTYSWTSIPVGFTSTLADPSVTPPETTTYTVTETITATGCSNMNSVVVTVNPLPAAATGADTPVCLNTATTLGAAAVMGSTYNWISVPAGFTSTLANPAVTPSETTTYTVTETITATGCSAMNSVVVSVNPLPAATAGADRPVCLNTATTLGAAAVTGSTYSWSSVPEGFTSTLANPPVTPLVTTTYTVTETITATSCVNSKNVVVTVNPIPTAPIITFAINTLTSDAPEGNQWYQNSELIQGETNAIYTAHQSGLYTCIVTRNGCSSVPSNSINLVYVGVKTIEAGQFELYPVPSTGMFTAEMFNPNKEMVTIRILNSLGSLVYIKKDIPVSGKVKQMIDMSNEAPGIYTITFSAGTHSINRKMIINRR